MRSYWTFPRAIRGGASGCSCWADHLNQASICPFVTRQLSGNSSLLSFLPRPRAVKEKIENLTAVLLEDKITRREAPIPTVPWPGRRYS